MKSPIQSKTLWVNLIIALAAFFPSASQWIAGHPDVFVWGFSVLNILLRAITKDKIEIL